MPSLDRRLLTQRLLHTPGESLRRGLVAFWNCDGANIAASQLPSYGSITLSEAGSCVGSGLGGVAGGMIYKAEGDTGYLYDPGATIANLPRFTYTAWVALPGLYAPMVGTYRNPTFIGSQDYSNWRVRTMYSIADGSTDLNITAYFRDSIPSNQSAYIKSAIDLTADLADFQAWHLLYTKYDGTDLTFGCRTVADHYTKTVTPAGGLVSMPTADWFPWYPRPDMGSTTTNGDAFGAWRRPLSAAELDRLWNAGAGLQYPFS